MRSSTRRLVRDVQAVAICSSKPLFYEGLLRSLLENSGEESKKPRTKISFAFRAFALSRVVLQKRGPRQCVRSEDRTHRLRLAVRTPTVTPKCKPDPTAVPRFSAGTPGGVLRTNAQRYRAVSPKPAMRPP